MNGRTPVKMGKPTTRNAQAARRHDRGGLAPRAYNNCECATEDCSVHSECNRQGRVVWGWCGGGVRAARARVCMCVCARVCENYVLGGGGLKVLCVCGGRGLLKVLCQSVLYGGGCCVATRVFAKT